MAMVRLIVVTTTIFIVIGVVVAAVMVVLWPWSLPFVASVNHAQNVFVTYAKGHV